MPSGMPFLFYVTLVTVGSFKNGEIRGIHKFYGRNDHCHGFRIWDGLIWYLN